jgi:hypothetical protein
MKKLSFLLVLMVLLLNCEKNDNTCNCNDPINDLAWLKDVKNSFTNCTCEMSVIQATFNKQTVFYTAMTDPLCDGVGVYIIFDCKGDSIKSYTSGVQTFYDEVTNRKILYRCKTK